MRPANFVGKVNNKGVTLVELVVTFALLGLFMVGASGIISYTIGIYYASSGATYGFEVANMISEKIVGELETARSVSDPFISTDGKAISFVDRDGVNVKILSGSKAANTVNPNGSPKYVYYEYSYINEESVEKVIWEFDPKAYLGYTVDTMRFERLGEAYPENVIRLVMILHNDRYGDYERSYFIKCANVDRILVESAETP